MLKGEGAGRDGHRLFLELTTFFVNNGIVQKKNTNDGRSTCITLRNEETIVYKNERKTFQNLLNDLEKTIVFYRTNKFSKRIGKNDLLSNLF